MAKVLFYFCTRPPVAIRRGNICFLHHVPPQVTCLDRMGFRRSLRGGWPCDPGLPEGQGLSSDATSHCTGSKHPQILCHSVLFPCLTLLPLKSCPLVPLGTSADTYIDTS